MATYVIGDIQGCFYTFQALLKKISFDPSKDKLWLTGDLVNRGGHSLKVLEWCYENNHLLVSVLGNHDAHLLAVAHGVRNKNDEDTFDDILSAPQGEKLLNWLAHRPLLYAENKRMLVHSGLLPQWTVEEALGLAKEVENQLRGPYIKEFLASLYTQKNEIWNSSLKNPMRSKVIMDVLTRLRICTPQGQMDFKYKGARGGIPASYQAWFELPNRKNTDVTLYFGHWGSIGFYKGHNVVCVDSGCVWGTKLTAFCLEDEQIFQVPFSQKDAP